MKNKETIEEIALRLYPEDIDDHNDNSMVEYDCNLPERMAFIEGYKMAQLELYSEEEVNNIIFRLFEDYASNYTNEALKDFDENLSKK